MFRDRKSTVLFIFVVLAVFISDRGTKIWAHNWLAQHGSVTVVPGLFSLRYGQNTGIAFGLFASYGKVIQWLSPVVFVVLILFFMKSTRKESRFLKWQLVSFALILGGATGNLFDRVVHHFVIDFLDVYVSRYHWPTFNVADSCICVGVGMLFVITYLNDRYQCQSG